jgi:hypothetical protein
MPISYYLNDDKRLLETRATGMVTADELERHLTMEGADGLLALDELFDARDATTDLTSHQVRHFVEKTEALARRGPFGAVAFVTANDVAFGMARMYQLLCDGKPVRVGVFRDVGQAKQWLEVFRSGAD